jgi:hypothetical protein
MASSPGTVSKILWHFTGGPKWNEAEKRQEEKPKPIDEAYKALIGILSTRKLRIGQYKEVVKVIAREATVVTKESKKFKFTKQYNVPTTLISSPVCCVADIPIMHLNYHAERYGTIAIGFHRDAAIRAEFSPVFYQLHNSAVLQTIHVGFAGLENLWLCDIEQSVSDLGEEIERLKCNEGHPVAIDRTAFMYDVDGEANAVKSAMDRAATSFGNLLAFVKSFEPSEFGTIYTEREWRSIKPFNFHYDDISMIIMPRNVDDGDHYERFVDQAESIGLPKTVSIVAWEDLVEH